MITRLLGVPQTFHRNDWNTWTPFNKNFGSWTGLNLNASPVSFEVVRKVYHRFLLLWPISFKLVLVGFACIQNSRSQLNSSPILPCDANGKDCIQLEPFVALFWVKIEKKQRIVAMYCVPRKGLEREKRKRKFHKAKPPRAHVKETLHDLINLKIPSTNQIVGSTTVNRTAQRGGYKHLSTSQTSPV